MIYRNKKILAAVLICLFMLVYIPIIAGSTVNNYNSPKGSSNIDEKGILFFWLAGHLKDVRMYEEEHTGTIVYNGTVVNGIGIIWAPKLNIIIPIPTFAKRGEAVELFPEIEQLHIRSLLFPNDHMLYSMWWFGVADFMQENETASFPLNQISI